MHPRWHPEDSDGGRTEAVASLRLDREGEILRHMYWIEVVDPDGRHVEIPLRSLSGLVTNTWAIVSFVLALTGWAPLAVVLAYVARAQIRRRGEAGALLAKIALVVGWVGVAIWALVILSGGLALSDLFTLLPPVECSSGARSLACNY